MKYYLKAEAVLITLMICTLFGCITHSGYLENRAIDSIVTREPLPLPVPDAPWHSLPMFRVVSLKQMQAAVRAGLPKDASSDTVQKMCGLNTVEGYLIDRKNKDVLIFGKVSETMPPLLLDDFIIAMRCAWKKYVVDNMFTPPGCSIDPSVEYLNTLDEVEKRISAASDPTKWKRYKKEYQKACARPQTVRILGMPFNTHFASVLVKADYDMKRLINGSDVLDIPGVVDMYALGSYYLRQAIIANKEAERTGSALSRFWFKPDQYHFVEQRDLVFLETCEISLLTQEQYITQDNKIEDKGRVDPYAKRVADSFTTYYSHIAQKRPIYRELKELMRMYIVLEAMYNKSAHLKGGLAIDYFLNAYEVPKYIVSPTLPGQSRYVIEEYERETMEAIEQSTFVFPICGGVAFDVFLKGDHFSKAVDNRFARLLLAITHQKPKADALYWDVVNG